MGVAFVLFYLIAIYENDKFSAPDTCGAGFEISFWEQFSDL